MIKRIANGKMEKLLSSNKEAGRIVLLHEEFLGKSAKVYEIYCEMLIKLLTGKNWMEIITSLSQNNVITLELPNDKIKMIREYTEIILKKSETNIQGEVNYVKQIFFIESILEISKKVPLHKKNIYATYSSLILGLSQGQRNELIEFLLEVLQVCKNGTSIFAILAGFLTNKVENIAE